MRIRIDQKRRSTDEDTEGENTNVLKVDKDSYLGRLR